MSIYNQCQQNCPCDVLEDNKYIITSLSVWQEIRIFHLKSIMDAILFVTLFVMVMSNVYDRAHGKNLL